MGKAIPKSSLVYTQDDAFCVGVGEALPLASVRRVIIGKWDALYGEALRAASRRAFREADTVICRSGGELLRVLRDEPADFVLTGLTFVDIDGIDVLHAIAAERLAARVLVVSSRRDEHSLHALRTARFDGFFDPFAETVEALVDALRQVAAGQGYISPALRQRMGLQRTGGVLGPKLTPAELQVFCVIGDGSEDGEAATRLGISIATVQTHWRNIMRKLGIATSAKLVREAVRLGVVRIKPDGDVVRPGFELLVAGRDARRGARAGGTA